MARNTIVVVLCLLVFSYAAAGRILLQGPGSAGPGSSGSGFNSGGSGTAGTGTGDAQQGSGGTTQDLTAAVDTGTDTGSVNGTSTVSGVTGDTTGTTGTTSGTGTTSNTGTGSSSGTTTVGTTDTSTGGNSGGSSSLVSGGAATGDGPTKTNSDVGGHGTSMHKVEHGRLWTGHAPYGQAMVGGAQHPDHKQQLCRKHPTNTECQPPQSRGLYTILTSAQNDIKAIRAVKHTHIL
ncbi:hypothetical protein COO60DRAFT_1462500 [Scenedesmus sp. NREL 46B-D3]|nr:hypothetical protein COO60DRAFT_1462500 [Scenedesmus sp. NREL 46B-D3]